VVLEMGGRLDDVLDPVQRAEPAVKEYRERLSGSGLRARTHDVIIGAKPHAPAFPSICAERLREVGDLVIGLQQDSIRRAAAGRVAEAIPSAQPAPCGNELT